MSYSCIGLRIVYFVRSDFETLLIKTNSKGILLFETGSSDRNLDMNVEAAPFSRKA